MAEAAELTLKLLKLGLGIKIGPFSMLDMYGTPYNEALHIVERYQLLDYEAAKDGLERDAKVNQRYPVGLNP